VFIGGAFSRVRKLARGKSVDHAIAVVMGPKLIASKNVARLYPQGLEHSEHIHWIGLALGSSVRALPTDGLDFGTYAAVSVVLLIASAVASYIPSRRATRVDPVDALRAE